MEFIDEETRPRFLLQNRLSCPPNSKTEETVKASKTQIVICISVSSFFIFLAFFSFISQHQILQFLLLWTSFSLMIGPFAPISSTGGDIRVGIGEPLPPSNPDPTPLEDPKKKPLNRRQKSSRSDIPYVNLPSPATEEREEIPKVENSTRSDEIGQTMEEEEEWNDEDFDLLKKQLAKHPVGTPLRWETIAAAFRGRHGLESVIKAAKSMAERRSGRADSFAQFLKNRKPLSKRLETVDGDQSPASSTNVSAAEDGDLKESGGSLIWSSGEDIALLNALKAFPKDVSMRWEKIAAAVPGKSKASCMKRIAELKKEFRRSKASEN